MTDNDFNLIPAVESLQSVPGLTPAQPREQRKRRPSRPIRRQKPDQEPSTGETETGQPGSDRDKTHVIDYRA